MLLTVIILYSLGGLLPVIGLIAAWRVTHSAFSALDRDLREIKRISASGGDDNTPTTEAMYAVRRPAATMTDLTYQQETIQHAILRSILDDLRGPALTAGVGVILATAGSLLSLTLS